jgi:hypothetical protein
MITEKIEIEILTDGYAVRVYTANISHEIINTTSYAVLEWDRVLSLITTAKNNWKESNEKN